MTCTLLSYRGKTFTWQRVHAVLMYLHGNKAMLM